MGKFKKQKHNRSSHHPYTRSTKLNPQHAKITLTTSQQRQNQPHQTNPIIPFTPNDRILLVGEGDFSFAHSLYTHHNCNMLIATCYDTASQLADKYPQSIAYIQDLESAVRVDEVVDIRILYGVDATRLGKRGLHGGGGKEVRKGGFDKVVFNFPHVGGLTKDVNRQVRHNQELLVNFFNAATPLLAPAGTVVVTIFEGEPYSLWNIRDLARHVGLKVGRSFKFQSEAYPGYKHARTLGNIEGGVGWKGEDRDARTYIFEIKDEGPVQALPKRRKRTKNETSDSDEGC
ncbi:MAG: hypothetical protein Q9202_000461 [Teloschistes flavicans]